MNELEKYAQDLIRKLTGNESIELKLNKHYGSDPYSISITINWKFRYKEENYRNWNVLYVNNDNFTKENRLEVDKCLKEKSELYFKLLDKLQEIENEQQ